MLVLRTLLLVPLHGYGIAKAIRSNSNEALDIEFGSLYPALKRLELKGRIAARWEISEHNRRAKYYRLTPAGRKQLQREHSKWATSYPPSGRSWGRLRRGANLEFGRLKYLLPSHRRAQERDMKEEPENLAAMAEPGELGNLTSVAEEAHRLELDMA